MVGGIAEYLWGLAGTLLRRGHDVRVALPHYAFLQETKLPRAVEHSRITVALGLGASTVTDVIKLAVPLPDPRGKNLPVYLLGGHPHFASVTTNQQIYQWPNHEPWVVYCKAVVEWLEASHWQPDIIHCQDAHCALLPVYIQDMRTNNPSHPLTSVRTVLTVHNLLNQGKGLPELVAYAGLSMNWFNIDGFEFYGYTNSLKAGLLWADRVNTVSPTYAHEIRSSGTYGFGLEGVLHAVAQRGQLTGILNGIDTDRWSLKGLRYDGSIGDMDHLLKEKEACQRNLFKSWGWKSSSQPVLVFRSRWDTQKGVLLLTSCMEEVLKIARCVFVTWGTPGSTPELQAAWQSLQQLARDNPQQLLLNPKDVQDIKQTATHYTLADFVLMPSSYEPCGLVQMECQRYGALPIVRQTGGLADTVTEHAHPNFPAPNGFTFRPMEPHALLAAIRRAIHVYHNPELIPIFRRNALLQENGWNTRIAQYEQLYRKNDSI